MRGAASGRTRSASIGGFLDCYSGMIRRSWNEWMGNVDGGLGLVGGVPYGIGCILLSSWLFEPIRRNSLFAFEL